MKPVNACFIILIFMLVFAAYFNSLHNDFIWDDEFLVRDNNYIKSFTHIPDIFKSYLAASSGTVNTFYRPLQELSYTIDHSLWGYKPFGFHLTNLILHGLCAIAVYLLASMILKNSLAAFITAALFGVHPINTEAVTYVAGRADSLYLLFLLTSFILFIKSIEIIKAQNRLPAGFYIFSLFFYILSMLSKEIGLILPLLLLLYIFSFYANSAIKYRLYALSLPFGVIFLVYALARKTILNFTHLVSPFATADIGLYNRFLTALKAICVYLHLFITPFDLHMERTILIARSLTQPETLRAIFVIMIMVIAAWLFYKHSRKLFFASIWFFIGFFPVSNLIPINSFIAEHWMYLPSIGIYMIAGTAIAGIFYGNFAKPVSGLVKTIVIFVLIALLASLSVLTFQRNKDWKDSVTFFKNTLKYTPDNARLHLNFGNTYANLGRKEESIAEYRKAIELRPDFPEAYFDLAQAYLGEDNYVEAKKYLEKTLSLKPNLPNALEILGIIEHRQGNLAEAEKYYLAALNIWPEFLKCHINLGILYIDKGDTAKAISEWQKVLEIEPNNTEAKQLLSQFVK